jgi:hypothetical protein
MDSTYASTIAILRRVFHLEMDSPDPHPHAAPAARAGVVT